jgi:hypothetical protein
VNERFHRVIWAVKMLRKMNIAIWSGVLSMTNFKLLLCKGFPLSIMMMLRCIWRRVPLN